jgi:hypothetical protein
MQPAVRRKLSENELARHVLRRLNDEYPAGLVLAKNAFRLRSLNCICNLNVFRQERQSSKETTSWTL